MKYFIVFLIECYQATLSPDHGPLARMRSLGYCCYSPTCSMYAKESYLRHGVIKGTRLTIARLLRCHPWARPAIDNVPK